MIDTVSAVPVSKIPQLPGPAVPSPKSSAKAEQLYNKTTSRAVIPTSLARRAPQTAGLLYQDLSPDE